MSELRKDYVLERWVLIAPKRNGRPNEFVSTKAGELQQCFFCPGQEELTGVELGRFGGKDWKVRWFLNRFPAVSSEGSEKVSTLNRFFTKSDGVGQHEVIVETPTHKQLAELSEAEIELVLKAYQTRIEELSKKYEFVNVFKNSGAEAGTSVAHSHSQVIATNIPNQSVLEKVRARRKFVECPHCAVVALEAKGPRLCFENSDWVAFAPFASRFQYECWVFPRKHVTQLKETNLQSLSKVLKFILAKVPGAYNMILSYAPKGEDLHFHIEILPRLALFAGFELDSDVIINTVAPEDAAAHYRSS